MWDRRMIGVPNRPEKKSIEIDLPENWTAASVAPRRQADVGAPALTYVTVISAVEAAKINAGLKSRARGPLLSNSAAARVDELLEAIRQEGYFSSWVIIEECTID